VFRVPSGAERARAGLSRDRPPKEPGTPKAEGDSKFDAWANAWCTIAWQSWQDGRKVDAQEALRAIQGLDPEPVRARFLRGEIAFRSGDTKTARAIWTDALRSGEDYRVRMALGSLAKEAGDTDEAERHFLAAEKDFPGFDQETLSAELQLASLYAGLDRKEDSLRALERRLDWDAGNLKGRLEVAAWHFEEGRFDASAKRYAEANEIDPFRRQLHRDFGDALRSAGRAEEALREYTVGPKVPPELDADKPGEMEKEESAEWLGLQAACLQTLGRNGEALERAKQALALDPSCKVAHDVVEKAQ
jgi:tetratricopeptide (TPR) repeat protein